MNHITKVLFLGAAMIGISLMVKFDMVPEPLGRWAPFMVLAMFPSLWAGQPRAGCRSKGA